MYQILTLSKESIIIKFTDGVNFSFLLQHGVWKKQGGVYQFTKKRRFPKDKKEEKKGVERDNIEIKEEEEKRRQSPAPTVHQPASAARCGYYEIRWT